MSRFPRNYVSEPSGCASFGLGFLIGLAVLATVAIVLLTGCTASAADPVEVRTLRVVALTHNLQGQSCAWTSEDTGGRVVDASCCPAGWAPVGIDGDHIVCVEL